MKKHPRALLLGIMFALRIPAQNSGPAAIAKSEEYLILGNATRGAGEPMIAVDPTNPRNVIIVAMGNLHRLDNSPVTKNMTDRYHEAPNSTITWLGVTHDRGRTWKVGELPILDHVKHTRCPDSFAAVTRDGTFLAGCEPRETSGDFYGGSYLVISKDKGETWGLPVDVISSYATSRFAPGLKPRIGGNSPWDRPFLKIDDATGVIYGQGGGGETDIDQKPGIYRIQSYITASTNQGQSFGTIYAWDSNDYPQAGRGDFDAANGAVAVVYTARTAPASESAKCPCVVFGVSHDQGKSFQYHVLKSVPAPPVRAPGQPEGRPPSAPSRVGFPGAGGPGGMKIAADQSKPGHFCLLVVRNNQLDVSATEDFGKTWSTFVTAGSVPDTAVAKTWMEYSRKGILGLMWRGIHRDGPYDIWSVVSWDGGRTFSSPFRVSNASSPFRYPERAGGWFGDDIQDLTMDDENVHMVWGDSRAGFLGVWYGRVPLASYGSVRNGL